MRAALHRPIDTLWLNARVSAQDIHEPAHQRIAARAARDATSPASGRRARITQAQISTKDPFRDVR
jgi:hypothetical protein